MEKNKTTFHNWEKQIKVNTSIISIFSTKINHIYVWLQRLHFDNIHVYFFPGIERGSDCIFTMRLKSQVNYSMKQREKVRLSFISLVLQEMCYNMHSKMHEKNLAIWDLIHCRWKFIMYKISLQINLKFLIFNHKMHFNRFY